jgi:pimeloyl-ACP methyl ester carboxylesterase
MSASPASPSHPRSCSCTPPAPAGACGSSTCSGWAATTAWRRTSRARTQQPPALAVADRHRQAGRTAHPAPHPSRRANLVGLSLGGAVAHTLLARHRDLLDRVVIDGCGALPAWWIGPMKLAVAAVSPGIHRDPVIGLFARMVGMAPSGRDRFAAELQAVSPRAFRRAFADGNAARISAEDVSAPARPCWWRVSGRQRPCEPPTRHWPP